ncbi:hypothetical protein WICPIJ_000010 [Wickerhamomyces pijperi]|uniref:Nascent polypeptide-associated complex subunit beta n=1 Tax=Wickerhamomyces pijperi TaxID=599730 RepID=A0A9P8TSD5_WICPI|nr:hypothetical protein WICPIJ_000010 [Wickerhamomyces pijperi]
MPIDQEKLAKLQKLNSSKVGGVRRKTTKPASKPSADDSKLQATLQKLNGLKTLSDIEEANFFTEGSKVLHFNRVGVQAADQHNVYGFYGIPQEKEITELVPGIIPHLGPENLDALSQIAAQIQQQQAAAKGEAANDDDIPDLVEGENFDADVE